VFDVIGDALSSLIIGWRSALCLGCGIVIACFISWLRAPRGAEVWVLLMLVALCYAVGLGWELFARRRRRRSAV
jgi:hypothetical protein